MVNKKEKINQENYEIIKEHYNKLLEIFSIKDNDILFLSWQHIIRLTKNYIDFFIFNRLKTKKNNYTIRMNWWIYQSFLKKLNTLSGSKVNIALKSKLKQEVIKLAKWLYRVWKDDSVIVDEKVCMSIFEYLKEFRYDYKLKILLNWKSVTLYYNWSWKEKTSYLFFLIASGLIKIDFTNLVVKDKYKSDPNIKIIDSEIISGQRIAIKKNLYQILENFFKWKFFKEEYYYITDIRTQWEKDLSNTIELFNDVIQKWLTYVDDNIKFDDRQIIEINWKKLYYDKNVKDLLREMYLFRFYPI